jgi:YVTN family beta-propeller protein
MTKTRLTLLLFSAFCTVLFFSTCMNEKGTPDYNQYPDKIGKIIFTRCATPGCHTDASKDAAAGLSLESWNKMFEGGTGSACVIPYRSDYSTLFYYVNTFPDLGVMATPTMPFNSSALSKEEVLLIRDWIDQGAPNRDGFVKFSDNDARKKFYVPNQGCDVVTVFDQASGLPMRYINVGNSGGIESPHLVKVSPDGEFWYACFLGGNAFQKYRTSDDSFVAEANVGVKNWNSFVITPDGLKAFLIDWSASGDIAEVDLTTMSVTHNIGFNYPHGSCLNPAGTYLYVTQQNSSSKIYKIPVGDLSLATEIDLFTTTPPSFLNTHDVRFSPDGSKYFVTCQGPPSEVRIFDAATDTLQAILPVGAMASEVVFSATKPYAFVTCMEDLVSFPGKRGSVAVINYNTNTVIKTIYTGHQPHGIEVDDQKKLVYVANRNATSDGPAPHHSSACGGRNGNVSFIDLNSLNMVTQPGSSAIKKAEVAADPYSVSIRH